MLVIVVCVLVVAASMVVLALAGLGLWRRTVSLGRTVGRAGEVVADATSGLEQGLDGLQRSTSDPRAGRGPRSPAMPAGSDGARLAARVGTAGGRPGG